MAEEEKKQETFQKDLEKKSNEVKGTPNYSDILVRVIHEGEELFKIHNRAMFLSGVIAGLEIGFSYLLVCAVYFLFGGTLDEVYLLKLFGLVYPLGFILVIVGKSALFTEQTSVLALPVLNGQRKFWELLRVWGLVIVGNVLGGMFFAYFIGILAPKMKLFDHQTMVAVGTHALNYEWWILLLSAITAGWLMGLLTWLLNAIFNSITRVLLIFMITGVIGFASFHHSIVGNIEVFGAFLHSPNISFLDYASFLLITLLGNGIGGAIVVGLFKYRIFETHYTEEKK